MPLTLCVHSFFPNVEWSMESDRDWKNPHPRTKISDQWTYLKLATSKSNRLQLTAGQIAASAPT